MTTSRDRATGASNGEEADQSDTAQGAEAGIAANERTRKDRKDRKDNQELRRLREELATQLADMTRLHELTTRLAANGDLAAMLRDVLAAVVELQHAEMGTVLLYDPHQGDLYTVTSTGFSQDYLDLVDRVPLEVGACGLAAAERRPVIVADVEHEPAYAPYVAAARLAGYQAVYSTPLMTLEGEILGAIATYFRTRHRPTEREIRLVEMYARQAAILVERVQLHEAEQRTRHAADQQAREVEAAFEAITDGVAIMDGEGRIIRMNRSGKRQLGLDKLADAEREFFGREVADRSAMVEMRDEYGQPIPPERLPQRRIAAGESLIGKNTVDVHVRTLDGRECVWNFGGAPIRDANGAIVGGVATFRDVTERRHLERAAVADRARWRTVMESAPEFVATCDADRNLTYINPAYEHLLGQPADESVRAEAWSTHYGMYLPDGSAPFPYDALPFPRAMGENRTIHGIEVLHRRQDGSERLVNWDAAPIRTPDGELLGAVAIGRDITEQRMQERALHERARQLEAIFAAVADGMVFYDAEGNLVQWNAALAALFEFDRAPDYAGLPVDTRPARLAVRDAKGQPIPTDQLPFMRAARGEVLTGTRAVDMTVTLPSGNIIDVSVSAAPLHDDTGRTIGSVAVYRDVTNRNALERQTRETLDALLAMAEALVARDTGPAGEETEPAARETARRLAELTRKVIGCQRVSITAIEPETEILRPVAAVGLAPELERLWYTGEQQSLAQSMAAYPDLLAGLRAGEVQVIDLREPRFQGADNPYAIRVLVVAPMCVGERLVGLLALDYTDTDHDYTREKIELAAAVAKLGALVIERERLRQERAAVAANALALGEANRRMDEFLGIASHELRTPLTSVRANVQLSERRLRALLSEPGTIDVTRLRPLQGLLARAERQTYLLDRLVNDLVDVSRIQNNKLEMRPEPVDLAEIVAEAVREQRLAWPERPIPLETPYEPVLVVADPDRIGQVVTNYLTNALKYSAEDRPVAVSLRVEDGMARLAVRDEGPGLTPEQAELVWERFQRVPGIEVQSGSGVGLGLGLHISKTIVERHGGQVGIESAPGAGATFWFTLPVASTETTGFNTEDTEDIKDTKGHGERYGV